MAHDNNRPRHRFSSKLGWALRGVAWGMRTEANFKIHLAAVLAVVIAAVLLRATLIEWCVLVVCIAVVLAAELFNTALEHLARAVTREPNEEVRNALDSSAGAVLLAASGAAIAGAAVFVNRLGVWLAWWGG